MDTIFRQPGKTGTKKDLATRSVRMSRIMFYLCAGICSMANLSAVNPPEKPFGEQYSRQLSMIAKEYYDNEEYDKAFTYYKTAADQGDTTAQYKLGEMYRLGMGTPQSIDLAVKYYDKAILGGDVMSMEPLGKLAKEGNDKAFESLKFFANNGYIMAYYMMQVYANNGMDKAIQWLETTALNGNITHQSKLGRMYYEGIGVEQDYPKAFLWSKMAAENGDIHAQHRLGLLYLSGLGPDYDTAFKWFKESAQKDHLPAFYDLAKMAENGYLQAFEYLQTESKNSNQRAKHTLGYLYIRGKLVNRDIYKSINFFKDSYEIPESIKYLEQIAKKDDDLNALYALEEIALKNRPFCTALDSIERLAEGGSMNALIVLANIAENDEKLFGATYRLQNIVKNPKVPDALRVYAYIVLENNGKLND